jgi:ABC-type transport system involved in multi-copper enzyme maturation permease subunit
MKSKIIPELIAAFLAEIRKLFKLKTHIVFLAITLSLILVVLALEFAISKNAPAAKGSTSPAPVNLHTIWQIFHFFSQYLNPLIAALIAGYQVGKEFEWKTFHQIQLKGQTATTYLFSKLAAFYALATGVYLVQTVVVTAFYCLRALFEGQTVDIPFGQIAADPLFFFTAIPIALTISIMTVSASIGIVLSLVYLCLLEMMVFPLISSLTGALGQHGVATVLSYSPMKLPVQIVNNSDTFLEGLVLVAANLAFIALMCFLSHLMLSRRQIGLIR